MNSRGFVVGNIYYDLKSGVTEPGYGKSQRNGLQSAIEEAENDPEIDGVMTASLCRIARSSELTKAVLRKINEAGKLFISVSQPEVYAFQCVIHNVGISFHGSLALQAMTMHSPAFATFIRLREITCACIRREVSCADYIAA